MMCLYKYHNTLFRRRIITMDIPKLFALYASKELNLWQEIIDCTINHRMMGKGKVERIYKSDPAIIIECSFGLPGQVSKFAPQTFEDGFILELEIPSATINASLVNLHNKLTANEKKRIKNEAERLTNKAQATINNLKTEPVQPVQDTEFIELMKKANQYFDNQNDVGLIAVGAELAKLLSKVIVVDKGITKLCEKVVSAQLTIGNVEKAIEWIDQINSKEYNLSSIREKLLKIKDQQGGYTVEDIKDAYTLNRLAALHKTLLAYRKAIRIYERSIGVKGNSNYAYNGIGGIYKELGQYDLSIEYYKEGYNKGANIVSLNGIGAAHRAKRTTEDANIAINYYKTVLEIEENDTFANNGIGAVYFDLGMYDEGTKHFLVAGNPEYLLSLFWDYQAKNQHCIRVSKFNIKKSSRSSKGFIPYT